MKIIINLLLMLILPGILAAQYTGGNGKGGISITYINAPLPVELASFTSNVNGRNIKLRWLTSSEQNNAGFDVERKTDNDGFVKVGYAEGKGSVNTTTNYSFEDRNMQTGKYYYRLKQIDNNGNFEYHILNGSVDVGKPVKFNLLQNYPNPFNPVTRISFDLPKNGLVKIVVFDLLGKEVGILVNETMQAGMYDVTFDASMFTSGVYFYRIQSGDFSETKRMLFIK